MQEPVNPGAGNGAGEVLDIPQGNIPRVVALVKKRFTKLIYFSELEKGAISRPASAKCAHASED
jgi:hypothetical protein